MAKKQYEKLFGAANLGRHLFYWFDALQNGFCNSRFLNYKKIDLFYKTDKENYEMYISNETLDGLNNFIFDNPSILSSLENRYKNDLKLFDELNVENKNDFVNICKLFNTAIEYMIATLPFFYTKIEEYCQNELMKKIKDKKEIISAFQALSSYEKGTSLLARQREYLSLLKAFINKKLLDSKERDYILKFKFFESSSNDNYNILNQKELTTRLKKDAENYVKLIKEYKNQLKEKSRILKTKKRLFFELNFDKKTKTFFELLGLLGWLRIEIRLNMAQPAETIIKLWYDKYEEKLKFPLYLIPSEFQKYVIKNRPFPKNLKNEILKKRIEKYIWRIQSCKPNFIYEEQWPNFYSQINISEIDNEIKGKIVFKGAKNIIKGEIMKIIQGEDNLAEKISKFKKGAILLSNQTTPAFIHAIKNAKAVITDEGGIMSHAAIISREFKIPCIVGTKIATKYLKDGDIAELDFSDGTVKIVTK